MFDSNFQYEPVDWRAGISDTVDPDTLLNEPVEDWFDYAPGGEGVSPPDDCLAIVSGLFARDGEFLVAAKEASSASFFAERFSRIKLKPVWGDQPEFANEFALIKRFGILHDPYRDVLLESVVRLHNEEGLDVVSLTTQQVVDEHDNRAGYWSCLACVLPFLSVDSEGLCQLFQAVLLNAKAGKFGWEVYGTSARLAQQQPDLGKELLDRLVEDSTSPLRCLLADLLVGLSRHSLPPHYEIATQWVNSNDPLLVAQGCLSLGAFDYTTKFGQTQLDNSIRKLVELESHQSDEVSVATATAFGRLFEFDARCAEAIERLSGSSSSKVKNRVSYELHRRLRECGDWDWFRRSLSNLAQPCETNVVTLDSLDFVVAGVAKKEPDYAIEFIESWLLNHEYDVHDFRTPITKSFQSSLVAISQAKPGSFQYLVTRWFLADDKRLHRAANDLISELAVSNVGGDRIRLELQTDMLVDRDFLDLRFVARKIMGYVIEPHILTSLIFSLVKSNQNSHDVMKLVVWAFRVYVGYNYRGASREWLDEKLENGTDVEKSVAAVCIDALNDYYLPLDELPPVKELSPPTLRVREYDKQMRKLTRKHQDEAKSNSVLSRIFSEINLKYGRRAAFQIEGKTQVSDLTSFETAVELPRGDLIDPVGMRHRRLVWRHEERSHLCD